MENKIFISIECEGKLNNSEIKVLIYEENDLLNFIFLNYMSSKNLQIFSNCKEKDILNKITFLIKNANIKMHFNDKNIRLYEKYIHKHILNLAKEFPDEIDNFAIESELPTRLLNEIENKITEWTKWK